jgi:hypothetical protein
LTVTTINSGTTLKALAINPMLQYVLVRVQWPDEATTDTPTPTANTDTDTDTDTAANADLKTNRKNSDEVMCLDCKPHSAYTGGSRAGFVGLQLAFVCVST